MSDEVRGRATHHHVPQQLLYVDVDGVRRLRLAVVGRAVVGLAQHDGEVAHRRAPLLRHSVGLGRKRKSMLALGVGQSVGEVGHGVVEGQVAHGIFRVLGLLLLLTSSLRHPKILIKEFSYFLMPCHQHGLRINLLV